MVLAVDHFAHSIGDTAFVEGFVGVDLISVFVSNPYQEQPALSTVDCYLADQLIETLLE